MVKYKIPKGLVNSITSCNNPLKLGEILKDVFPDAFINWDAHAFTIGDIIQRKNNRGEDTKYLIVKTGDNKCALLNIKNSTLWKNISTIGVGAFNSVSIAAFMEISNGVSPSSFKKLANKK